VSRIEAGERIPSLQVLRHIAERLGVSADYLATGEFPGDPLLDAELAARSGDRERAQQIYQTALEDRRLEARAQIGLGRLALDDGDHEGAVPHFEVALASESLGESDRRAAGEQLGRAYALLGRFEEALAIFEAALAEAKEMNDRPAIVRTSVMLANTHIDRGSYQRAEEVLAAVLEEARASSDPVALSNLFWSQSRLHASQQRNDLAAEYARMAHATLAATEHTVFAARALLLLAHLENDRGNASTALELSEEAYPTIAGSGNRYDVGMTLLEKARALGSLGEGEQAAGIALGAIPMFDGAHPTSAARGYGIAANVFREFGDQEKALELYELAAETLPSADRHLSEIFRQTAAIYEERGETEEAMRYLKLAYDTQRVGTATT
jgi:tetratricopeptide (TPR) repeat protein